MFHEAKFFVLLIFIITTIRARSENVSKESLYCYNNDLNHKEPIFVAWKCDVKGSKCLRVPTIAPDKEKYCLTALNVCNLICDPHASLWPLPTGNVSIQKHLTTFNGSNIVFINFSDKDNRKLNLLLEALQMYFTTVLDYSFEHDTPRTSNRQDASGMNIKLVLENKKITSPTYNVTESYRLKVESDKVVNVVIEANNYFGARHGIETLLQLIVYDEISGSLLLPSQVDISDAPFYKHRGILLDTSRNYYPIKAIKRLLDGMAYNKLNIFHWHMIDSQSFPFTSSNLSQMTAYGAYGPTQVYKRTDILDLVEYATVRGIKIVPEIDTPAHIGEGWQYLEKDLLLNFKTEPWTKYCGEPPCGILNPTINRTYEILELLYSEFNQLFDTDAFHMGGDEIRFVAWNETQSILDWLSARNMPRNYNSFMHLWVSFQMKAMEKLDTTVEHYISPGQKQKIILWTSELTADQSARRSLAPNRYIIQVWEDSNDKQIIELLNEGYQVIVSNIDVLYLNYGFGSWIGECGNSCMPYISWQQIYRHDPIELVRDLNKNNSEPVTMANHESLILGSEACLWSEQSDQHTMDQRMWPRAAALAERLWSNPATNDSEKALGRLLRQRERMAARNIAPDVLQPLWCHQNQGLCHP